MPDSRGIRVYDAIDGACRVVEPGILFHLD